MNLIDKFFRQAEEVRVAAHEYWADTVSQEEREERRDYLRREGYDQGAGSILKYLAEKVLGSDALESDKERVREELRRIKIRCDVLADCPPDEPTPGDRLVAAAEVVLNIPVDEQGRPEAVQVDPIQKEDLTLGDYGKKVVIRANASLEMVYIKNVGEFYIPITQGTLWKVIRKLVAADGDGYVDLNEYKGFQGAVGGKHGEVPKGRDAMSVHEFLRYIHPEGTSGRYRIMTFPKPKRSYSRRSV